MSDCTPSDLMDREWSGLTPYQRMVVQTELLYRRSESTDSANEIMASAKCFGCDQQFLKAIQTELLCRISNL
jgi:hypothetical protein